MTDRTLAVLGDLRAIAVIVDRQGTVLAWTREFGELASRPSHDIRGRSLWEFASLDHRSSLRQALIETANDRQPRQADALMSASGGPRWIAWTCSFMSRDNDDSDDSIVCWGVDVTAREQELSAIYEHGPGIGIVHDITEQERLEEALQHREERLRLVFDASAAGSWTRDPDADHIDWDEGFRKLYGFAPDEPATSTNGSAGSMRTIARRCSLFSTKRPTRRETHGISRSASCGPMEPCCGYRAWVVSNATAPERLRGSPDLNWT